MASSYNVEQRAFTGPQRLDKAIHTLEGIMKGIALDSDINEKEVLFLKGWLEDNSDMARYHPFNEIYPVVQAAVADGIIDEEEKEDILWLCNKIRTDNNFFDKITSDMQRLQAILGGIIADLVISEVELKNLKKWLELNEHLRTCYPYDELESLISSVLEDGVIDEAEHKALLSFFVQFSAIADDKIISGHEIDLSITVPGVCAMDPEISFNGKNFSFTGKSARASRAEIEKLIINLGCRFHKGVNLDVDYLIIGAGGSTCWAYACYGRKVERAIELRKKGEQLLIIHEHDFWDAIEDTQ